MNAQAQKMNAEEVIANEQEYVLGVYSRPPFVIERGEGSTLYDSEGNAYLDCVSGIAVNALGYNDAGINQAMQEALSTGVLHVSNLYHTAPHARPFSPPGTSASTCADRIAFSSRNHFILVANQ